MEKMNEFADWIAMRAPVWVVVFVGAVAIAGGMIAVVLYMMLAITFPPTLPLTLAALTYMTWGEYQKDKRK